MYEDPCRWPPASPLASTAVPVEQGTHLQRTVGALVPPGAVVLAPRGTSFSDGAKEAEVPRVEGIVPCAVTSTAGQVAVPVVVRYATLYSPF